MVGVQSSEFGDLREVVRSYRDLQVWQKGRILVSEIYELSKQFPGSELYGLTSQIRRAAVSIPSNIAEGSSKGTTREFLRFISISYGSLCELETHLYLAYDLGYIDAQEFDSTLEKAAELGRMLNGLQRSLEKKALNSELRTLDTHL